MKQTLLSLVLVLIFSFSVFADECVSGDCVNGYGTYIYNNGTKHVGWSKNGLPNGFGTVLYGKGNSEGNMYVGEFKDNNLSGQGTYIYSSGETLTGIWKNGNIIEEN
jgi:hypothetical protein